MFGAFALLNVAARPPVEQRTLESFAIDAPSPVAAPDPRPAAVDPVPPSATVVQTPTTPTQPVAFVPTVVVGPATAPAAPVTPVQPSPGPIREGAADAVAPMAPVSTAPPGAARTVAPPTGPGAISYAARVRAWLLAHKRYPRRSRLRGEEGVVQLRFVLDRAGHLLDGTLVAGSDHAALDTEALAMLRRAVPYPAPPVEMRGERIEIAAAIVFDLPHR